MSKLVRLTTDNENCVFNSILNDEIEIPENGEVAFQNLSIEVQKNDFILDGSNEEIDYQVSTVLKTVKLNNAIYTEDNFDDLLKDIQNKFNSVLSVDNGAEIGLQWQVKLNSNKKVQFRYLVSNFINLFDSFTNSDPNLLTNNITFASPNTRRNGGTVGTDDSFIAYSVPFTRSCGVFGVQLRQLRGAGTNGEPNIGVIIGLTNERPTSTNISLNNIVFGIQAQKPTTGYRTINNGNLTLQQGKLPKIVSTGNTSNDYLQIRNENGKINIGYYSTPTTPSAFVYEKLAEFDYDNVEPLYPVIIFRGPGTDVSIKNIRTTEDPFVSSNSINLIDFDEAEQLGAIPKPSNIRNTLIKFRDASIANYLGFNNARTPLTGTLFSTNNELIILSDNVIFISIISDSFTVILDNIDLESYDTQSLGKLSILATIPQSDQNNSVIYDAKMLNFIKIRNKNPLRIRNIKARILDSSLGSILTNGRSVLTILFK